MKKIVILFLAGIVSSAAVAQDGDVGDLKLRVQMIAEGPVEYNYVETNKASRDLCVDREYRFDFDQIVAIGEKIWDIVLAGQPTLNFEAYSATAIPASAQCAFNLSNWSVPYSRTYQLVYENLYGMDVVSFTYKVIFSYGGRFNGQGSYLANVSIHPVDVSVLWGQNFDARVSVGSVLNIGEAESPVAGMEVSLEWNISNVLKDFKSRRTYFVDGYGRMTEL